MSHPLRLRLRVSSFGTEAVGGGVAEGPLRVSASTSSFEVQIEKWGPGVGYFVLRLRVSSFGAHPRGGEGYMRVVSSFEFRFAKRTGREGERHTHTYFEKLLDETVAEVIMYGPPTMIDGQAAAREAD